MSPSRPPFAWSRYVLAVSFAAALGFGLWGYAQSSRAEWSLGFFVDALYASLQLFVLEFNLLAEGDALNWQLNVARWLAAAVSAGALVAAAYQLFHERWAEFRRRRARGHCVVCGVGHKGIKHALDAARSGETIILLDRDPDCPGIAQHLGRRVHAVIGDATQRLSLVRANVAQAATLFVTCGSDHDNLEIVLQARELVVAERPAHLPPLRCYVHIGDTELVEALRQQDFAVKEIECQFFNYAEQAARMALAAAPLEVAAGHEQQPTRPHVQLVIVGFGSIGKAFALQAARIGQFRPGSALAITIVDPEARQQEELFLARYPAAREVCEFTFDSRRIDYPDWRQQLARWATDSDTRLALALCHEDSGHSLSLALNLPREVRRPEVTVYVYQDALRELPKVLAASASSGPQLVSFGELECYSTDDIGPLSRLDQIARRLHEAYREQRRAAGTYDESDPALAPWEALSPGFRTSNRLHADHIDVKLRAIGCRRVAAGKAATGKKVESFTTAEVELMAEMEHARWCAERYFAGWQRGSPKDKLRKISPDLVPWADLPEATREYDRRPVRDIPALLAATGQEVERMW